METTTQAAALGYGKFEIYLWRLRDDEMWVALISPYPIACTRNTEMMLILFELCFPFAYLQYLSRYTIHVDRHLKTHLEIFFKEKTVFKVYVSS